MIRIHVHIYIYISVVSTAGRNARSDKRRRKV
jgi:hypothetical protein